ncbi:MAG: GNAT family N-acetyltransferase [Cryomorphaceae bacterium]
MLSNNSIQLRALEEDDLDSLFLWENNPENWRVSHTVKPYSRHELYEYIHSVGDIYSDKQLRLIIEDAKSGDKLGSVDLFDCDFKNRRTGIGILIAEEKHRGKGLASEVLSLILPYCFQTLGFHQIYCDVHTGNPASMALFEKFGFREVGIKKDWTYHNGTFYDECLMQKINPDNA